MIYGNTTQPAAVRKRREARVKERQMAARAFELRYGLVAHLMCDVQEELGDEVSELVLWERQTSFAIEAASRLDALAATEEGYEAFLETNNMVVAHFGARLLRLMHIKFAFLDEESDSYRRKAVALAREMARLTRLRHARRIRALTYTRKRRSGVPEPRFAQPAALLRRQDAQEARKVR